MRMLCCTQEGGLSRHPTPVNVIEVVRQPHTASDRIQPDTIDHSSSIPVMCRSTSSCTAMRARTEPWRLNASPGRPPATPLQQTRPGSARTCTAWARMTARAWAASSTSAFSGSMWAFHRPHAPLAGRQHAVLRTHACRASASAPCQQGAAGAPGCCRALLRDQCPHSLSDMAGHSKASTRGPIKDGCRGMVRPARR